MKYYINITIFLIIILYSIKVNTVEEDKTIHILMNRPGIEDSLYLESYNKLMNDYVSRQKNDYPTLSKYKLEFSYCILNSNDKLPLLEMYQLQKSPFSLDIEYARYLKCIVNELNNSKFDMIIMNDQLLYSDISYIQNYIIESTYDFLNIEQFLIDFNNFKVDEKKIQHHASQFFHSDYIENIGLIAPRAMLNDDLSFNYTEMSIGLSDSETLIDHFVEYVGSKYGIPTEKDSTYFDKFFKSNSNDLYDSFRRHVLSETGGNINKILDTSVENAYQSFINREKNIFKGKASYYPIINHETNGNIMVTPLSKDISVLTGKYITINKASTKMMDDLILIALELTSKEMQLFRAREFGSLPTFDIANINSKNSQSLQVSNQSINKDNNENGNHSSNNINNNNNIYSMISSEIFDIYKALKPIDIKKFFYKDKFSANYMEIRFVLPEALKVCLRENNNDMIISVFSNLLEIKESTFYSDNPVLLLSIFIVILAVALLLFTAVKIYTLRKHPILIPISPRLTNLIIIGISLNILFPCFNVIIKNYFHCRMYLVLKFLISNLIFLPILAMTFRTFYIFNNSSVVNGKKLNDKRLLIFIGIVLIGLFLTAFIISLDDKFYLRTTGTLLKDRIFWCYYDNSNHYNIFTSIYYVLIVTFLVFFGAFALYIVGSLCSVYILVGSKLTYIRKHPNENENTFSNKNNLNISDFIPSNIKELKNKDFLSKRETKKSKSDNHEKSSSTEDEYDHITNDPNNYFFNKTLENLSRNVNDNSISPS
ncbi:hypothetical protein LY90DRAFT_515162 [Neocallimastix californiae]|uniref:G-protein coupled receptors family 3 profile domain-containing protein n=1 Tax=Neocallimastix californiae TaxID=1754190 RepID=A0A1Y2ALS1_9FUNG|nr:hypothetical protein LY90DRAFT_515162 [Neocallimastix californiae]|eukprot:ORY23167.1 hypothetical protein LY90DRAFT_515162 [Neocallimastix californiae]